MGFEGVKRVRVSLMAQKADVDYQSDMISADDIVQHIIKFGFGASLLESAVGSHHGSVDLQVRRSCVLLAMHIFIWHRGMSCVKKRRCWTVFCDVYMLCDVFVTYSNIVIDVTVFMMLSVIMAQPLWEFTRFIWMQNSTRCHGYHVWHVCDVYLLCMYCVSAVYVTRIFFACDTVSCMCSVSDTYINK